MQFLIRYIFVFLSLSFQILNLPAQSTSIPLLVDDNISLNIVVRDHSSIADKDWLSMELVNKTKNDLAIEVLDYSVNTFEENPLGENIFKKGGWGSGKKFDLIHWFHDQDDMIKADKKFRLKAGATLKMWKHMTNKASIAIESEVHQSGEICALIEAEIRYSHNGSVLNEMHNEDIFCTNWTILQETDKEKLKQRFLFALADYHDKAQHTDYLALLTDLRLLLADIHEDKFIDGVLIRKNALNNKERLLILRSLQLKNSIDNERLREHYVNCIQTPGCQWKEDLEFYWHNDLIEPLFKSKLFVSEVAAFLELYSDKWSDDAAIRDKVYAYLQSHYKIDLNAEITEDNFSDWYNKIKYLASSRHDTLVPYFRKLLNDARFFPVREYTPATQANNSNERIVHFRVCDVAYVCLLRMMDQIQVYNDFARKKIRPTLYINPKWEGNNPEAKSVVQLKNPYTLLEPNLRMAEKHYYYFGNNRQIFNILLDKKYGHE